MILKDVFDTNIMNTHQWVLFVPKRRICGTCGLHLILVEYTISDRGQKGEVWIRMEAIQDRVSGGFSESPKYGTCDEEKARSILES
jgi:hypothetical protein